MRKYGCLVALALMLGDVALSLGDEPSLPMKISALSAQLEKKPMDAGALFERGRLYRAAKEWEKADADFAALVTLQPMGTEPLRERGVTAIHAGKHREARRHFEAAIALEPKLDQLTAAVHDEPAYKEIRDRFNAAARLSLTAKATLFQQQAGAQVAPGELERARAMIKEAVAKIDDALRLTEQHYSYDVGLFLSLLRTRENILR